jgi:hypothetical protein
MTRSHVFLLIVGVIFARCSYDSGYRKGVEDGWWDCASEYGVAA